jgi:hypothetical protein
LIAKKHNYALSVQAYQSFKNCAEEHERRLQRVCGTNKLKQQCSFFCSITQLMLLFNIKLFLTTGAMEKLTNLFVEYISELSGQPVTCGARVLKSVPQYIAQHYELYKITVGQRRCLGILLKDGQNSKVTNRA